MKIRLETVIKDTRTSRLLKLKKPYERFETDEDEIFLDGPVCRRLAVLDFNPKTGQLSRPVRFRVPTRKRLIGGYQVPRPEHIHSNSMMKVSVFGTVLKTMKMFEEADTLGRRLVWAFGAPQLLIVPRAGRWPNAFYDRDSHSLQFFYFPSARKAGETVYTALSHDIVAHETGHAILDGIAPDLYHALSPQSLALHEAIADVTALLMAFRSRILRDTVLKETNGSIEKTSAFSGIAAEFATERDPAGRHLFLRDLNNTKSLRKRAPQQDRVTSAEPHALSEVLGGALYSVLKRMYESEWKRKSKGVADPLKVSGRSLFVAAERFKRMVLRALDYLPPGEVSFSDLGRAIIASDLASYPDPRDARGRNWFRDEFLRRGFVDRAQELDVDADGEQEARRVLEKSLSQLDLDTLVSSDWAAYAFANSNREHLRIPPDLSFHVRPRLDVTKLYYVRGDGKQVAETGKGYAKREVRECVFKVKWDVHEANALGTGYPANRTITVGTTLAIDWATKKVRARLTSEQGDRQRSNRDELLRGLVAAGSLRFGGDALGPDDHVLPSVVRAESTDGVMVVRGLARLLHVACIPMTEE